MKSRHSMCCVGLLLLAGQFTAVAAPADQTVLKRKGAEPETVDSASYSRVSKEYRVAKGNATLTFPEAAVEYCRPPRPEGFTALGGIAALEGIIDKYHRLWWDVEAFKKLVPLYVKNGEHTKAIRLYTDMRAIMGGSMPISLQHDYWTALDKAGQKTTLLKELADTITRGDREASAWAYLMRGDVLRAQERRNEALVDGYLKTVVLFEDIASCRKIALEKTIQGLEDLGDSRAGTFRKMLRDEFPQ